MRKTSAVLPSRQTPPSNGSSCNEEFVFEVRFKVSSKKGHEIANQCKCQTFFASLVFNNPGIYLQGFTTQMTVLLSKRNILVAIES